MRAHWRHLANTIQLCRPSAHLSPQPIRQIDQFSRFCTAHGRKCLYFTMGAPIHHNCPFLCGIWTPCNTWCLGPCEPKTQTARRSVQPFLHRWLQSVPILWFARFPLKIAASHGRSGPPCSLGTPESSTRSNGNSIASPVFAGITIAWVTDRPTDRPTEFQTRAVGRPS